MEKTIAECMYKRITYDKRADVFRIYRLTCHLDYGDYINLWDCIHRTTVYAIAMPLFKEIPDELRVIDDKNN